jgi:hypothetical protein
MSWNSLLHFPFILLLVLLTACQSDRGYHPAGLEAVSYDSLVARAHRFSYIDYDALTIRDPSGQIIGLASLDTIANPEHYYLAYYADAEGKIVEMVLQPGATAAQREQQRAYMRAMNEGPEPQPVAVDCTDKVNFLQETFDRDQASRGIAPEHRRINHENLERIISFIETCGIPGREEVSEEQMAAIWAVLQHNPARYRKRYLPALEAAAERGDIHWGTIAMLTDRTLLDEGKPQVYGTQLVRNPATGEMELGELADPERVNALRAERGMEPLEEYLREVNGRMGELENAGRKE